MNINRLDVSAYTVPTDLPEADGTFAWDSTTIVIAQTWAGDQTGLGFTYGDRAVAALIDRVLSPLIVGRDPLDVNGCWNAMLQAVRNIGRPGIASMAIAAIDISLWDLKARLLDLPLVTLLGSVREEIPIYGSGGFTSYSIAQLESQLGGWINNGIRMVKMKV